MGAKTDNIVFSGLSVRGRILRIASAVIALGGALICFFFFLRYHVMTYAYCLALCILGVLISSVSLFRKPARSVTRILAATIGLIVVSVLLATLMPWGISSRNTGSYKKNMRYLSEKHYSTLRFPSVLPDDVSDYEIRFSPNTFGRKANLCVEFRCGSETLDSYVAMITDDALISPISIEDAQEEEPDEETMTRIADSLGEDISKVGNLRLKFAFPDDINEHKDALVYIVSCEIDNDSPKTEAVIIDQSDGWVCFSKLF
ncbi:MAG: hypothetical protein K6E26_04570 [Clostridiales bacterium]|nr:hypothetical protein [Clostridiales bacterium]MCR5274616.1 hypothetical protein [Clostridiales bacterium]